MQSRLLESTPHEGLKNGSHIDVEVYYTKGGARPRGYYLSATPVTHKEGGMVSTVLFTGMNKLLIPASRYSAKQFEQAVNMGRIEAPELIKQVLEKERAA